MKKTWVVDRTGYNKPECYQVSSDKLEPSVNAPEGMVRYTPRKNSTKWQYVFAGETQAEAATKYNKAFLERIEQVEREAKAKIDELKSHMVKVIALVPESDQ